MDPLQQTFYMSSYVPAEAETSWAVAPYNTKKHWVPMPQFAAPMNGLGGLGSGLTFLFVGGAALLALLYFTSGKPVRVRR